MTTPASVPHTADADQDELHHFRNECYDCLTARADGLFELLDGLCCPTPVAGIAHLTLAPSAHRGHGSAYAALAPGDIDTDLLRDALAAHRPAGWLPNFAVDATTWARCDAECSPERGFYYHPSPALQRTTHRGRLVVPVARRAVPDSGLVDRTGRRAPPGCPR